MSMTLPRLGTRAAGRGTRTRTWFKRYALGVNLGVLIVAFQMVLLWQWVAVVIPAGCVGVKWHRFVGGTDTQTIYAEGMHFLWPWDTLTVYNARLQQSSHEFDVLSRDGMMLSVNIATRFHLNGFTAGLLHKYVGPDYTDKLLTPTVGSFARIVFSRNTTDAIYTTRRAVVQDEIRQAVAAELAHTAAQQDGQAVPWLVVDDVLILGMRFPPDVQAAVNRKMEQRQVRDEYAYRLEREELESKRKEVEARGIARFQSIVGAGISDTYLRWKGIDATLALAQSPNAKIIVIGNAKDGMPLILGGGEPSVSVTPGTEVPPVKPDASQPGPRAPSGRQAERLPHDVPEPEQQDHLDGIDETIQAARRLLPARRPYGADSTQAPSTASKAGFAAESSAEGSGQTVTAR